MKNYILCVIFVLVAVCVKAQDITVLQINAKWNEKNNYIATYWGLWCAAYHYLGLFISRHVP